MPTNGERKLERKKERPLQNLRSNKRNIKEIHRIIMKIGVRREFIPDQRKFKSSEKNSSKRWN